MVENPDIKRQNGESDWPIPLDLKGFKRHSVPAFLLFVLLIIIYSNSFECSWHFDDYANIVNNDAIHIQSLSWTELEKSMFGIADSGRWSRPLAYASFAVNYYFHGLDVFGYHVINFIIHYLAAFFLYLFILNMLRLPIFKDRYRNMAESIALLSAVLWSINPLQVSAVTYIVQRMASMSALFYILAMYLYMKGRMADQKGKMATFFTLSFIAGLLSIGSKENAAMLPVSLFFFDLILIRGFTLENIKKTLKYAILAVLVMLLTGFLFFDDFSSIIGDYSIRPFTAGERLITEPRVILFYVSLLLYPITSRLTLIHDFDFSTSLIHPWTTGVSIIAILVVLSLALLKARRWPLIAYCVIFFFLNHAIEGSFFSLELIFEHRNYLPSMLFFVPLSILFVEGLNKYYRRKALCLFAALALTLLIMIQGVTVYIQNNIWHSEISLWQDNAEKAPHIHHVRQNLATAYFIAGRLPEAFEELNTALKSYVSANYKKKARTDGLLAEYYYLNEDYDKALLHYRESLKLDPELHQNYYRIAEIMLRQDQSPAIAEDYIRKALSLKSNVAAYHLTYARILMKKDLPDLAKKEVKIALSQDPDSGESYSLMAGILRLQGRNRAAEHFDKVSLMKSQR